MRKVFTSIFVFSFVVIFVFGSALSQTFPTDKGSKIIAGEFSFASGGGDLYENSEGDKVTTIQMDPFFSYFIIPGLAVGVNFLMEMESQGDYSSTAWGAGPRVQYFIGGSNPVSPAKGKTYPFLDAAYLYMSGSWDSGNSDHSWSGSMIRFGGGVLHMVSNSVGVYGEAAYSIDSMTPEEGDSESGSQIHIVGGFAFFMY